MRAKFIYEKFEEESDPITDMGIGTDWHKIKKGSIIHSTKTVYLSHPKDTNAIGDKFIIHIPKDGEVPDDIRYTLNGYFWLVLECNTQKGKLYIGAAPFSTRSQCQEAKKYSIKRGYQSHCYTWGSALEDIETWNEYFKVLEK